MTVNGWLQIIVFFLAVVGFARPLGIYMARVFEREHTFVDVIFRPIERLVYKISGIDESHEMRWTENFVIS